MKDLLKSKGMWAFVIFMFIALFINVNDNKKIASAEDTNNSNYYQNNSSK